MGFKPFYQAKRMILLRYHLYSYLIFWMILGLEYQNWFTGAARHFYVFFQRVRERARTAFTTFLSFPPACLPAYTPYALLLSNTKKIS